jgi:capsular polysaccharide biosynthesis protein
MNPSARALVNYWWLVVAGLVVGVLAAVIVVSQQSSKKYTAEAKLFVNAPNDPYLRTQEQTVTPQAPKLHAVRSVVPGTNTSTTKLRSVAQPPAVSYAAPDTDTLVKAANLYPFLITSDAVKRLREQVTGKVSGTVTATALNSSVNGFGVYHESPLPIIDVLAKSKHSGDATKLADGTGTAFAAWIAARQKAAKVPPAQRIAILKLAEPKLSSTGGPSAGLPLFVGLLVLLGFCGLAIVADRSRGPRRVEAAEPDEAPNTVASPNLGS